MVPPIYVKPFVKRQKNDATDAEAICEAPQAASRPTMRFVAVKTREQQSQGMFRTRDLLVRQRTQTINALRDILRSSASSRRKGRPMWSGWQRRLKMPIRGCRVRFGSWALRVVYADHHADRQLVRVGHPSTRQPPRTPPGTDPRGSRSPHAFVT